MTKKTEEYIVRGSIVLFFVLYAIGYAWMIEPKERSAKMPERSMQIQQEVNHHTVEKQQPKSLLTDWPLDLGKYFYWIDIDPGYEMENEEYEVIGESGGNLIVRKHNDWPDISGHFEWYCNEKLTKEVFVWPQGHMKNLLYGWLA